MTRPVTETEMQILNDLGIKAVEDAKRSIDTALDLAIETAGGTMGMFLIALKVASSMITGAGVAIRNASEGSSQDDCETYAAALLLCHSQEKPVATAKKIFKQLTKRDPPKIDFVTDDK